MTDRELADAYLAQAGDTQLRVWQVEGVIAFVRSKLAPACEAPSAGLFERLGYIFKD